ncbi:MAG: hypothetical protein K2N14_01620 [Clostridia bacterium]|nr:hypothetical protein [Clostridia bacterium]
MSKRITKIICTAFAVISAATLAFAPACSNKWSGVSEKDNSYDTVTSNGGFLTQTGDYVYFINGKASNTDSNKFGSVLKGSVQRIKKSDLDAGNYAKTDTVVPSVIYSGSYNAGIYIYGDYIYYTSPTTEKNTSGEVLNSNLDFKRTKLDGTGTSGYIWQSSDNAVDYRYVEVNDTVYIIYAISENLYGTSATNIHSVNCNTGANTMLAYNVASYAFDTEDPENPYIYYTMNVPQFMGGGTNLGYNQLYTVRADVTESPRTYTFDEVENFDASKDPVYINMGDYVFDGIGKANLDRVSQLNYAFYNDKNYELLNDDYTYAIKWYKNGTLYYTRQSKGNSGITNLYTLDVKQIDADNNGRVDNTWDAVDANKEQKPIIRGVDSTEYTFVTIKDELYAFVGASGGITRSLVNTVDGKLENTITITSDSSATFLELREEHGHLNLYYSVTGGNGYTFNRIAVDGTENDYRKLSPLVEPDLTYRSVKILNLDAVSGWYMPEFVGDKLIFASETSGMSSYNYVMVCDLTGSDGEIMDNNQINKYNEKFEAVTEKIEAYDDEENADGTQAYEGLSNALKYLYYTGDVSYIDELVQAYIDVEGRNKEYAYSEASVAIYKDFAAAEGDWTKEDVEDESSFSYKENTKKINGEDVHANSRDYYYTVLGRMTDGDSEGLRNQYKSSYMKDYPVDNSTWWEKLSTGEKVGFIIGMVAAGLIVIGGVTVLTIWLIKRKKNAGEDSTEKKIKVDITDDKSVDVYGEDGEKDEE